MMNPIRISAVTTALILLAAVAFAKGGDNKTADKQSTGKAISKEKRLKKDQSLYVSPRDALKELGSGKTGILVDVRSPDQFVAVHVAGSINIPVHFIRTKQFLLKKKIIIVDTGFNTGNTEKECRRLTDEGYSVQILHGGITGLTRQKSGFELQWMKKVDMSQITPEVFHQEKNYDDIVIIDSSEFSNPKTKKLIPFAVWLPLTTPEASARKAIDKIVSKADTVIAFNNDGKQYGRLMAFYGKLGVQSVFYLRGGFKAYTEYLKNLEKTLQPENLRSRSGGPGCGSCGK